MVTADAGGWLLLSCKILHGPSASRVSTEPKLKRLGEVLLNDALYAQLEAGPSN